MAISGYATGLAICSLSFLFASVSFSSGQVGIGDYARGPSPTTLAIGSWLLSPTVFFGGFYDNNPNQSPTGQASNFGGRLVPSIAAETGDGIHRSIFYGMMDARAYTETGATSSVAAHADFTQIYQPLEDLTFKARADYTRQKDLFSTFGIDWSMVNLNPTGVGLSPVVDPQIYNQYAGVLSVTKDFGSTFLGLTGSVVDIVYDSAPVNVRSPNGVTYTGGGRGGLWLTPWLNAFVDAMIDRRQYAIGSFDSQGFRTTAGLGTDQIGLIRGEVFAGYQRERFESQLGSVDGAVFGGRLIYDPIPGLTIKASVDEKLGVSQEPTLTSPFGGATRVTTSLLETRYAVAEDWSAAVRFGYIRTSYLGSSRIDNAWTGGGTITYNVWQNIALTLDYQHTDLQSNVPLQSFLRDIVSLGVTYSY